MSISKLEKRLNELNDRARLLELEGVVIEMSARRRFWRAFWLTIIAGGLIAWMVLS